MVKLGDYPSAASPCPPAYPPPSPIKAYLDYPQHQLEASIWVKLLNSPSPYSHNQALLLCQESENLWLGWVPGHGEVLLFNLQD